MSSSAPTQSPGQGREKKGLGKLLSRAKTVFRKSESSRRKSTVPQTTSLQPAATTTEPTIEANAPTEPGQTIAAPAPVTEAEPSQRDIPEGATRVSRAHIQEERARRLGAKFGIEFAPHEWAATEGDVLRIEKTPRMRIHRQCHKCQTGFGAGTECPSCKHVRCKKCTRNPAKRTDAEKEAARARKEELVRERKENAPIIPSYDYSDVGKEIILKRPVRTGTSDLVYRPPRVRVRRYCHACNTLITSNSKQPKTCDTCGHKRCDDCPRQPEARKKYPYGYPHDEPGTKFAPIHRCHECRTKFPQSSEDGTPCSKCSHAKCPSCLRVKPQKVDPYLDTSLQDLQARMAGLTTVDS